LLWPGGFSQRTGGFSTRLHLTIRKAGVESRNGGMLPDTALEGGHPAFSAKADRRNRGGDRFVSLRRRRALHYARARGFDSDIPRDAAGRRIEFPEDEVVLGLHDEGEEGRLFKMPEF
jgi:hypothetical protein